MYGCCGLAFTGALFILGDKLDATTDEVLKEDKLLVGLEDAVELSVLAEGVVVELIACAPLDVTTTVAELALAVAGGVAIELTDGTGVSGLLGLPLLNTLAGAAGPG